MIATTIDQSKRLLAAGVERKSADMRWTSSPFGWHLDLGYHPSMANPAWSLSALWDLFYSMDKTHDFDTDMNSEELIETLVRIIIFRKK